VGAVVALSSQAVGGNGGVVLGDGKPNKFRDAGATPNMYSMLPQKKTLFPHAEFCNEMSMVCALMACCLRESSEYGSSGQNFLVAWARTW
jgi:hypothetical protein